MLLSVGASVAVYDRDSCPCRPACQSEQRPRGRDDTERRQTGDVIPAELVTTLAAHANLELWVLLFGDSKTRSRLS